MIDANRFRKGFYLNPQPGDDEDNPVLFSSVIVYFSDWEKRKKHNKLTKMIPTHIQAYLKDKLQLIFHPREE